MKKSFLFACLIAFGMNAKAQITLEQTYNNSGIQGLQLQIVHLTFAGYKYLTIDTSNKEIKLYNLNHSLHKTIIIPLQPQPNNNWSVDFVSDELFNTNSSDIEYLVQGSIATFGGPGYIRVYDENGNVLFAKDTVSLGGWWGITTHLPIFYTDSGVKMILYGSPSFMNSPAMVYSLPGKLPCNDCTNGVITGLAPYGGGSTSNFGVQHPYPNPASTTRIDYTLPNGVNQGEIVFYSLQGKEVKRFKVDRTFDHLLLSTADLPSGTYFYQLQTSKQNSEGKKMVVIK